MIAIYLNAGNDRNGNPRRGWAIIDTRSGNVVDFVDEGYQGTGALELAYPGIVATGGFMTTPGEYRQLLKLEKEVREQPDRGARRWGLDT